MLEDEIKLPPPFFSFLCPRLLQNYRAEGYLRIFAHLKLHEHGQPIRTSLLEYVQASKYIHHTYTVNYPALFNKQRRGSNIHR